MPDNVKYSYPVLSELFRGVVHQNEILHVTVQREPRYSAEVGQYLKTISKARRAVQDSKLVFKSRRG